VWSNPSALTMAFITENVDGLTAMGTSISTTGNQADLYVEDVSGERTAANGADINFSLILKRIAGTGDVVYEMFDPNDETNRHFTLTILFNENGVVSSLATSKSGIAGGQTTIEVIRTFNDFSIVRGHFRLGTPSPAWAAIRKRLYPWGSDAGANEVKILGGIALGQHNYHSVDQILLADA